MKPRFAIDLGLAAVLALFVAACLFAHPTGDDFVYAANARAGWWAAWLREYVGWSGRYSSNALVLATPLRFGVGAYRGVAVAVIGATVGASLLLVRAAFPAMGARDALTCALAFCVIYLSQVPSVGEAIYWYTSAATYQLWVVPAALYVWFVSRAVRGGRVAALVAGVMLIVVAGFNEVTMVVLLGLHVMWFASAIHDCSSDRKIAATMLSAIAIGGLLVFLSPGNAVRASMYSSVRHHILHSVTWTALQTLRFGARWIASAPLLFATILFTPLASHAATAPAFGRRWLQVLGVGLLSLVPAATFPAYWETGTLGQHRTVDVAYFAFLVLWFAAVAAWTRTQTAAPRMLIGFAEAWRRPLAVLFVASVAFTGNAYEAGFDLVSRRLARFDAEMSRRYQELDSCRERATVPCMLEPIADRPGVFIVHDVSPSASDWVNMAYARFFGVAEVRRAQIVLDADVRH